MRDGCVGLHADYLNFLRQVTPENQEQHLAHMRRFNLGPVGEADCPVFDGMFDYFRVPSPLFNELYAAINLCYLAFSLL